MNTNLIFAGLLFLGTACRRPSTQIEATLTPTADSVQTAPEAMAPEMTNFAPFLKAGDEFMAIGNEPSWSLTINPSKNYLRFKSLGGDSLALPMPQRTIDPDGRIRFMATAPNEGGELTVLFRPDSCVDGTLRQRFDYHVDVTYKGKTYAGCGASLRELSLLNDIWVLQTLRGNAIPKTAGRGELPRLEIQLADGRVAGTTGCNRLTGNVLADTRQIKFGPLATTRMACPGEVARLESDLLKALNQPLSYRVADGTLTLLRDNTPVMTFGKTD